MNCPKCGLQTLPDQKFCRACGAGLPVITQPLAERAGGSDLNQRPAIVSRDETHPAQRAPGAMLWGFIIMFIGVATGVIGKKLMHDDLITTIGILVSLAGMFLTVYPYLSPSSRKQKDFSLPAPPEVLTPSPTLQSLPQGTHLEYIPSITERTTSLLENSPATTPKQKETEESQT